MTRAGRAGAGFRSKFMYGSGFFHMRMKLPSGYTAGVVTTFYVRELAPPRRMYHLA